MDARDAAMAEAERDKYRCAAGNANYCSGDPVEIITFTGIMLVGGATAETFILGGGVAAATEAVF
jgi:hypothetical protein